MKLISSDKSKCVKCNACVEICPMRVIEAGPDGFPEAHRDAYKICINCGYCVDVCSLGALKHLVRRHRSNNPNAALKRLKRIRENRRKREQSSNEK